MPRSRKEGTELDSRVAPVYAKLSDGLLFPPLHMNDIRRLKRGLFYRAKNCTAFFDYDVGTALIPCRSQFLIDSKVTQLCEHCGRELRCTINKKTEQGLPEPDSKWDLPKQLYIDRLKLIKVPASWVLWNFKRKESNERNMQSIRAANFKWYSVKNAADWLGNDWGVRKELERRMKAIQLEEKIRKGLQLH